MSKIDIENTHKKLLAEWRNHNQALVKKCLDELQKALYDPSNQPKQPNALLTIMKDYNEISALYYVNEGNLERFGLAIKEVLALYDNQQNISALKSEQQYLMHGLYLMFLLATNKVAEFHMFIEKIDFEKRKTDPFLDTPIKLEHYLMEGAYNSLNLSDSCLPSPYYKPFMSRLKQAVQNEIAVSLERSYRTIPVKIAMKQLFLKDENEALAFGGKRGWIRKNGEFLIAGNDTENDKKQQTPTLVLANGAERVLQPLDSEGIIRQCLHYASQLERIV